MPKLNNLAFKILCAELDNCFVNDQLGRIENQIVLQRLEKLRSQTGSPASLKELRKNIVDIFPQFSETVLKQAASANQPPRDFPRIKWTTLLLTGLAGAPWMLKFPYPMTHFTVGRTVPILLLPNYLSKPRLSPLLGNHSSRASKPTSHLRH